MNGLITFPKNDKDVFGVKIIRRASQAGARVKTAKLVLKGAKNKSYWQDKVARLDRALAVAELDLPRFLAPHLNRARKYPEGTFYSFEEGTARHNERKAAA